MREDPCPQPESADGAREAAIRAWDEQLAQIDDPQAWVADQYQLIRERGMLFAGQPAVRVARPNLVAESDVANDQAVITSVTRCLRAAAERVLGDPELAARTLGGFVAGPVRALLDLPHDYGHTIAFGRYDGSRRPDGLAVLEFNGGLPGGIWGSDAAGQLMRTWPPFEPVSAQFGLECPDMGAAIVNSMRETHRVRGGAGDPVVALAVPVELRDYTAGAVGYLTKRCAELGVSCVVADPGEFSHAADGLSLAGQRVDVVVRVFFTNMLAKLGDRLTPLVRAVAAGDVVMLTPFRSGILGHKTLFALVTDPATELDVEPADLARARSHLPWTRIVGTGATTDPDGVTGELDEYARTHRERLVLKPADGTGGAGVLLGWECGPQQWESGLAAAHQQGVWILQDRIDLGSEGFPVLAPGLPNGQFVVDHNPLVINDRVAGYFARLAPVGELTNMTGGIGSTAPTFVVRGGRQS